MSIKMCAREVSQKAVMLTVFCLLSPLIIEVFQPHRMQSETRFGSGNIGIQDFSKGVAKLFLVLDEETGSPDFQERSTTWLVIRQFNVTTAIPLGRADPDWKLVGTNNITIWHWKLEKTFYLQYQTNGNPFFIFPSEVFTVSLYLATNLSRWFSSTTDIPNFSVAIAQQQVDYDQFFLDFGWSFQPEGCPYFLKIDVSVFHDHEYQIVVAMLYIILCIVIATAPLLFWKRSEIKSSDFLRISSSLLIFAPVFFFTFRNSIAPSYLTTFDAFCFIAAIIHGSLLLGKIYFLKK